MVGPMAATRGVWITSRGAAAVQAALRGSVRASGRRCDLPGPVAATEWTRGRLCIPRTCTGADGLTSPWARHALAPGGSRQSSGGGDTAQPVASLSRPGKAGRRHAAAGGIKAARKGGSKTPGGSTAEGKAPATSSLSVAGARSAGETRVLRSRKATQRLKTLPVEEREKFFSELQRSGRADVYHYSAMLSHAADGAQAESLFEQMTEAGVRPNLVTYNTAIHKHQESGDFDRAKSLLSNMAASGVRPDVVSYTSLIDGLSRSLHHRQVSHFRASFSRAHTHTYTHTQFSTHCLPSPPPSSFPFLSPPSVRQKCCGTRCGRRA